MKAKQLIEYAKGGKLKEVEPLIINFVDHTGAIIDRTVIPQSTGEGLTINLKKGYKQNEKDLSSDRT